VRYPGVSVAPAPALTLGDRFARELPEMAVPWRADEAPDPRLLVLNEPLAAELGLDVDWLRGPDGVRFLVGNDVPGGAHPVAQAYAGHQFGFYNPRLGDGRALLLGEIAGRDLHLKGSGPTPFSRGGDGLAAVGPMLREYVVSEAMHALGIPTTRSLAVVGTGRRVRREALLPGAVLARVASSHLRVGSFQYARATGDADLLRRLADVAIARHHPAAAGAQRPYLALFESVVAAQASLVARWMLVGFIHGVMNTDNMTISGETIDYGPCAFLEAFDPATVYSSIDEAGRYAYGNQPVVAEWDLARFAEALLPLIDDDQDTAIALAVESLGTFRSRYSDAWLAGMRHKLGLPEESDCTALVDDLLGLMQADHVDHTSLYRALGAAARGDADPARNLFLDLAGFDAWLARWWVLCSTI
jgi:serine/tyrosine/threonine adenylyltransferase